MRMLDEGFFDQFDVIGNGQDMIEIREFHTFEIRSVSVNLILFE